MKPKILLILLLVPSCKPPPDEFVLASAEAISTGNMSLRNDIVCGPRNQPAGDVNQMLRRIYDTVPEIIREEFPEVNELVVLTNDELRCKEVLENTELPDRVKQGLFQRVDALRGCWTLLPFGRNVKPVVYLQRNSIHNGLLALMTYLYTEWFVDTLLSDIADRALNSAGDRPLNADEQRWIDFLNAYGSSRVRLAKAAYRDIAGSGHPAVLNKYEDDFGVPREKLAASREWQNFILAETVDSYYCAPETSIELDRRGLTNTRIAFADFASFFGPPWYHAR